MEILQLSLAKLLLLTLQIQLTLAATPIPAPVMPQDVLLAPPAIESLTHYPELVKLGRCESGNRDNIKVLDVNNRYSYGRYQFQARTFLAYGKLYNLIPQDLTKAEPLIYDGELQGRIADKMLSDGLWRQWFNCLK